jgi:hypothetical protein
MIRYANQAQFARAHLLRPYNDLLIFVEDKTCQNMHVRVFSAVLGSQGRVSHVFPLLGRRQVIDAALSDPGDDVRRVYVVDGDFDRMTGRAIPACPRLHRLSVYSMENLLLTERALVEIALESAVELDVASISQMLVFARNKSAAVRCLLPLFERYAVVNMLDLAIPTTSYAVLRMCLKEGGVEVLSPRLVGARVREIRREIVKAVGWQSYKSGLERVRVASRLVPDTSALISGKDYLLPLTHAFLRIAFKLRDSFNGLRVRLARHFDSDVAPDLREFMLYAVRSSFQLESQRTT